VSVGSVPGYDHPGHPERIGRAHHGADVRGLDGRSSTTPRKLAVTPIRA
jgi:hypothetical protein